MDNNGNRKLCNEQSKGGTCVNIEFSSSTYDENKYKCLCKDGFKGPKCNEGKKNKFLCPSKPFKTIYHYLERDLRSELSKIGHF